MDEINDGRKTRVDLANEESIYFRDKRMQLLENDELSYEEEGFMSGYGDIEEYEEVNKLLLESENDSEGEI